MSEAIALPDEVRTTLTRLRHEVEAHCGDRTHDHLARIAIIASIDAGLEGNAAVGALLAGPTGNVIARDRNRMLVPYFRSDLHAEMALLTSHEEQHRSTDLKGHTLLTSLEPCEMCLIRIINSGVTEVLYVAPDHDKGAITGPHRLAPHWTRLAESQRFAAADCDPRLAAIALEAFEVTISGVTTRLMDRRSRSHEREG